MAEFPQTALLSEFTGPAENPLSEDGAWAQYGRPPLQRSGTGTAHGTVEFVPNGMYWTRDVFIGQAEVWGCLSGGGLGAALEGWRVALWVNSPDSFTGYLAGFGGGIGKDEFFRRYDGGAGSFVSIGGAGSQPTPDKLGLRVTATTVEYWREDSGVWTLKHTSGDTTYRGPFYAAIETEEQGSIGALGFSCFGGGVLNRQHIYRILRGKDIEISS